MRFISTKVHGVLDYLTVLTLLALPRIMEWDASLTLLLTVAAVGVLLYSLLTRYELGAAKILPMKGHLALDALSGLMLIGAAFLFRDEGANVMAILISLGIFELAVTLLTETEPEFETVARQEGTRSIR